MERNEFEEPVLEIIIINDEVIKTSGEVAWWGTTTSGQDA